MRNLTYMLALVSFLLVHSAYGEYCWMVGCKGREGFIPTYIVKNGKKVSVFECGKSPPEGTEATLVNFVNMSESPSNNIDDGPYNLGPGFIVKILGYVGNGKEIVRIKIINDNLRK